MKFNKVDLFMLVCNDRIIFSDIAGLKCEMTIDDINRVPNVPFYDYLFEPGAEINYTGELDLKPRFRKRVIYCLVPDDITFMEKKAIEDYCMMKCQAKSIVVINQCDLLDTEKYNNIAVARTDRCISVVCSMRLKNVKNIVYLEKNAGIEEIKKAIVDSVEDNRFEDIEVCINNCNDDMNDFEKLGKLVDCDTMMNNAKVIVEKLKIN